MHLSIHSSYNKLIFSPFLILFIYFFYYYYFIFIFLKSQENFNYSGGREVSISQVHLLVLEIFLLSVYVGVSALMPASSTSVGNLARGGMSTDTQEAILGLFVE